MRTGLFLESGIDLFKLQRSKEKEALFKTVAQKNDFINPDYIRQIMLKIKEFSSVELPDFDDGVVKKLLV
jgi:hypothetical protein